MSNFFGTISKALFSRKYVSIDIAPTEIRVLGVRSNTVEKWASGPIREGLIKDGIILEPQELGLVLENLFTSLSLPRDKVTCTVTGLPFTYRTIVMPDTGVPITREAIERAARKEMSFNEPDMFIYWREQERRAQQKETVYFVVAVPKVAIRPLAKALEKARIKMYELDLKPLAVARLVSARSAMVLSLENKYIDMTIVADGTIKTMYSFPLIEEKGEMDSIVREIVRGMDQTVKSFNHDYPDSQVADETPLLVVGGLTTNHELLQKLSDVSGHQVTSFELPVTFPSDFLPYVYAANLGLVLRKSPLNPKLAVKRTAQYKDININLLSSLLGTGTKIKTSQVAAVLATLLVLSLAYYGYNLWSDAGTRLIKVDQDKASTAAQLAAAQKTNKDYLAAQAAADDKLQKTRAEYDAVMGAQQFINNAHVNCAGDIRMVIAALPDLAGYQAITVNKAAIEVNGRAEAPNDVLEMADDLELESQVSGARVVSIQPAEESVTFTLAIQKKQ